MIKILLNRIYKYLSGYWYLPYWILNPRNFVICVVSKIRISKYLKNNSEPKINLGSFNVHYEGWLNADVINGEIFLDIIKKFPFKNNTFSYIYTEHLIEHIEYEDAVHFIKECYRVLSPKGVIRVSTPDLDFLIKIYLKKSTVSDNDFKKRLSLSISNITDSRCWWLNKTLRACGHKFVYSEEGLSYLLKNIGFKNIKRCNSNQSVYGVLKNLEKHSKVEWVLNSILNIEAVK